MATKGLAPQTRRWIAKLARRAFPDWRGHKVRLTERPHYTMNDSWSGGSRDFCQAVELATGRLLPHADMAPWDPLSTSTLTIPEGFAIIEHSIFQGHDVGVTLYVRPWQVLPPAALPKAPRSDGDRLRAALKAAGFNARQVTVRERASSLNVTIRDAGVRLPEVEAIARKFEHVDHCRVTGEILQGGNTFVFVAYDGAALKATIDSVLPALASLPPDGGSVSLLGGAYTAEKMERHFSGQRDHITVWNRAGEQVVNCHDGGREQGAFAAEQLAKRILSGADAEGIEAASGGKEPTAPAPAEPPTAPAPGRDPADAFEAAAERVAAAPETATAEAEALGEDPDELAARARVYAYAAAMEAIEARAEQAAAPDWAGVL